MVNLVPVACDAFASLVAAIARQRLTGTRGTR